MVVQKKQQTPAELFLDYAEKLLLAAENSERRNLKLEQEVDEVTKTVNIILQRLAVIDSMAATVKGLNIEEEIRKLKEDYVIFRTKVYTIAGIIGAALIALFGIFEYSIHN
jgi:hypothetical protein